MSVFKTKVTAFTLLNKGNGDITVSTPTSDSFTVATGGTHDFTASEGDYVCKDKKSSSVVATITVSDDTGLNIAGGGASVSGTNLFVTTTVN